MDEKIGADGPLAAVGHTGALRSGVRSVQVVALSMSVLALSGCAAQHVWADDAFVARSAYSAPGPATVTLITSINSSTGSGSHTALMIDGAQRLLFDPAGHWTDAGVPERNDVWFGMSPAYLDRYMAFQSEGEYTVHTHTVQVSPAIAQQLSQVVQTAGPIPSFYCSQTISGILGATPGFERVDQTFFPTVLMGQFANAPGVTERIIEEVSLPAG